MNLVSQIPPTIHVAHTTITIPAPTIPYLVSVVFCNIGILWLLVSQIPPKMHHANATTTILFKSSVLTQCPTGSHHTIWCICCDWYRVTLVCCKFEITDPAGNVLCLHHNNNYFEPCAFSQRPTNSHQSIWASVVIRILTHWYL